MRNELGLLLVSLEVSLFFALDALMLRWPVWLSPSSLHSRASPWGTKRENVAA